MPRRPSPVAAGSLLAALLTLPLGDVAAGPVAGAPDDQLAACDAQQVQRVAAVRMLVTSKYVSTLQQGLLGIRDYITRQASVIAQRGEPTDTEQEQIACLAEVGDTGTSLLQGLAAQEGLQVAADFGGFDAESQSAMSELVAGRSPCTAVIHEILGASVQQPLASYLALEDAWRESGCDTAVAKRAVTAKAEANELLLREAQAARTQPSTAEQPKIPSGMSRIPTGTFTMGSAAGEVGLQVSGPKQRHEVTITHAFYIGTTEVTQGQWKEVMGSNPSTFASCGADCPVETITWLQAVAYANARSAKEGLDACYVIEGATVSWPDGLACGGYRLPTEAEWEYAARNPVASPYAGGPDLAAVAWVDGDPFRGMTHSVGLKRANGNGLYDMTGNVNEWVWDSIADYSDQAQTDPLGPVSTTAKVYRGGCWMTMQASVNLANRTYERADKGNNCLGLRVARSVTP